VHFKKLNLCNKDLCEVANFAQQQFLGSCKLHKAIESDIRMLIKWYVIEFVVRSYKLRTAV